MAEKIESMQNYAGEIAEEIKSEYGQEAPIAGDLRIDMGEYGEIMGEKLQRDYKNLEEKNFQHSKEIDWGEAMELFSTLMMYRFFKSKGILTV